MPPLLDILGLLGLSSVLSRITGSNPALQQTHQLSANNASTGAIDSTTCHLTTVHQLWPDFHVWRIPTRLMGGN